MSNHVQHVLFTVASALGLASAAVAQGVIPLEGEFQINTNTVSYQTEADLAVDSEGNFVVVWSDLSGQDGDVQGVFMQRFDSVGQPLDGEVQVNTYTTDQQRHADVAFRADGDFIVTWSGADTGDTRGVVGQRFDSAGARLGDSFQVNTYTTSLQLYPSMAVGADGGFVVVWASFGQDGDGSGIFLQRFDSTGAAAGDEVQVNTTTFANQIDPKVASLDDGDFVVVWTDYGALDGDAQGVFAQRFDSAGLPVEGELQVNTTTLGYQFRPDVASVGKGFVVVWADGTIDGSLAGIGAQRFDETGSPVGSELLVNTYTIVSQNTPSVTGFADGEFVVAWRSPFQDGDDQLGLFGQRIDSSGNFVGGEFHINTTMEEDQLTPELAAGRRGEFVAVWESDGQDGDLLGVFGQRFAVPIFADGFESGDTTVWSSETR